MIHLQILAVGTLKERWMREGCAEYLKRIGLWSKISVTELEEFRLPKEPSAAQIALGIEREGGRILERLPKNSRVAALCIEGKQMGSDELARYFEKCAGDGAGTISFIIGGSHGLSQPVKNRADLQLSMSRMTFPHQLARLMLCEQIYRALSITAGAKYHK